MTTQINISPKPFRPDATVSRVIYFSFMLFLFMGLTFCRKDPVFPIGGK